MSLHVALTHRTSYRYDRPVSLAPQVVRLRPAPHCRTPILAYSLKIAPEPHFINWQQDPFGNFLARVVVPDKTAEFTATVDLVADMAVINPFDFFVEETAEKWPFAYEPSLKGELAPYLQTLPDTPLIARYVGALDVSARGTVDFITTLNRQLARDIAYRIRMEPGVQTPEETLQSRSGSCRDSGWLLVQILRRLGLAARFVSGYLIQLKPDVAALDGPAGAAEDFTDLHAWAEVFVPGAGWIGLDPTSGLLAGEGHIPLAATPSPGSAAAITGAHEKAEVAFAFSMHLARVRETPRVTKPYSEADWQQILGAGAAVDARLQAGDVRLSMGGEPTFVAVDDMQAAEWNVAALGPTKRAFADKLVRRLRARFADGGLLHYGQGKWYPGEPLPRWAFAIYWRADGKPLWHDAGLIDEEQPARPATIEDAERFSAELCRQLGLPADSAIAAYEDAAHHVLVEQKLPLGVGPGENKLADAAERHRLMRVFDQGLDRPSGYVVPLHAGVGPDRRRRWTTERWSFRRGHLFLVPGDSPAGFRMPLFSLGEISAEEYPHVTPADPFGGAEPLGDGAALREERRHAAGKAEEKRTEPVRTAMAVEPREGHLCVFLPPLQDADDYAALVAAIEAAAAGLRQSVHLEGYAPPFDARLNVIKVTPDPGVIEVNIHPATSWEDGVAITTAVYEEARSVGLGADKFLLDGRHTGTGGGNHIVVGGATPADSPFLRRPDLLASIVAYWQNHPSLSYLFSGMFVGPTSQAPRVDEARHDSLYELEIALRQVPRDGAEVAPWLVDRLFRNLLVDVTGNTHRAEICIDKLYSPDSPTGRLGLVEFRAFEMPPHARMSLAQQLLIRALIACFWEKPYRQPLVRWGTALHDRFMLPHFLWADFGDVCRDLQAAGFAISAEWFRPHLEFRFPHLGAIEREGVRLELRQALEPWPVLGEESSAGGTTRPVDSSLERIQATVTGAADERYVVACNGIALPLAPAGTKGMAVAGIRFRAWRPPTCLHPTIKPHAPLTFDVMDTWSGRSVGGCRYHVAHPGGRVYESVPVNALEAEARRLARFEDMGHSPAGTAYRTAGVHPDFPLTLDFRQVG
ncbi:MAG: transglutaminase family protein [Hyphomicrobiaceae bacterium]|nr:MAG: transglutaminase family protein [Hyphomicrobiaceae bacterium]